MKHACLLLLVAAVAAPCMADTTWVTVGSPVTGNAIPFWGGPYNAMRFQTLYLQSEINQPGEIIAFGWMGYTTPPSGFYDVRVSLCHTGVSALSDTFAKNYDGNQPQLVLQKDTIVVGKVSDWYYFPCSFVYNNSDNLLLEIQWRGSAGNIVHFMRNTNQGAIRRVYAYSNDTASVGQSDAVQGYYARIGFIPTGVNELEELPAPAAISVEPTLGRTQFSVRMNVPASDIRVVDIAGRAVARLEATAGASGSRACWHTGDAPAGVYVIEARAGTELLTRQVVVTE